MKVTLDHIRIKNFRGIDFAECSFGNVNFIVGKNGSGKTTLMAAISRFIPSLREDERLFIDGDLHFKELDSAEPVEINYEFSLTKENEKSLNSVKVKASRKTNGINRSFLNDQHEAISEISDFCVEENFKNLSQRIIRNGWHGGRISPIITKRTDNNKHAATSKSEEQGNFDSLRARVIQLLKGEELSEAIDNEHPKLKENVISTANEILGEQRFDNFHLGYGDQLCVSRTEGIIIPWMGLSGGEQSILNFSMAVEFEKKTPSQLLFLEEPETNVHPTIQNKLLPAIIKHFPSTQIFISTHSPYIFSDHLKNTKIIITRNDGFINIDNLLDGKTLFKKPTWGEISYLAYDLGTFEYHNELFGMAQKLSKKEKITDFDKFLNEDFGIPFDKIWIDDRKPDKPKKVSVTYYIRSFTHHTENELNDEYTYEELKCSIDILQTVINKLRT